MKTYQKLQNEADAIRAKIDAMEADESIEEWTPEMEAETDRMAEEAWKLADEAAVLHATELLKDSIFAARVTETLDTMPPGPTNLGDPGVWHNGKEYWAYEVVELAETENVMVSAA